MTDSGNVANFDSFDIDLTMCLHYFATLHRQASAHLAIPRSLYNPAVLDVERDMKM